MEKRLIVTLDIEELKRIIEDCIKDANTAQEQDKIEGLNKRHVAQIIRRNMSQRVKPSKKVYSRKNSEKDLAS